MADRKGGSTTPWQAKWLIGVLFLYAARFAVPVVVWGAYYITRGVIMFVQLVAPQLSRLGSVLPSGPDGFDTLAPEPTLQVSAAVSDGGGMPGFAWLLIGAGGVFGLRGLMRLLRSVDKGSPSDYPESADGGDVDPKEFAAAFPPSPAPDDPSPWLLPDGADELDEMDPSPMTNGDG